MNAAAACALITAAVCFAPAPDIALHRGPDAYILEVCGTWWCHTWELTTAGTWACTIRTAVGLEPHYRAEKEAEERAACMRWGAP